MYKKINKIDFPKSKNININMMPIIVGNIRTFPEEIMGYKDIIESCGLKKGDYAYLTINEGFVKKGSIRKTPWNTR